MNKRFDATLGVTLCAITYYYTHADPAQTGQRSLFHSSWPPLTSSPALLMVFPIKCVSVSATMNHRCATVQSDED